MNVPLNAAEARVIGSLIEKQITTPDQYPLSLNALVSACNQKSNRDPVMDLDESTVQSIVDALVKRHMVIEKAGFGSRVPKYHQIFCNAEFGSLKLSPLDTAIICELLLRGPQTPGELRARAARMASVSDASMVETALEALATRAEGALVARLPREPGRREARYAQLFTGPVASAPPTEAAPSRADVPRAAASSHAAPTPNPDLLARIAALEAEVAALKRAMAEMQEQRTR
jgi:hypothetical protein